MTNPIEKLTKKIQLTAGAETLGVILVTGQIIDEDGGPKPGVREVLFEALGSTDNKTTLDVGAQGTKVYAGKPAVGASSIWVQTDVTGVFIVSVTDAQAADVVLCRATANDGIGALLKITFT